MSNTIAVTHTLAAAAALAALVATVACGGNAPASGESPAASPTVAAPATPAAAGPQTPDPGRRAITVQLIADEKGSRFEPNDIEAHRGDVIRFTLSLGVHNVDFLPDSNPGVQGLPAPSDMLQLAGQTYDMKVALPKGHYYFQCDPHAALGMRGHLEVEE
ncbi:MAG TPA: plastocyanin/azurin family copper-binding protein [Gemmatimonadaceae bacterium]